MNYVFFRDACSSNAITASTASTIFFHISGQIHAGPSKIDDGGISPSGGGKPLLQLLRVGGGATGVDVDQGWLLCAGVDEDRRWEGGRLTAGSVRRDRVWVAGLNPSLIYASRKGRKLAGVEDVRGRLLFPELRRLEDAVGARRRCAKPGLWRRASRSRGEPRWRSPSLIYIGLDLRWQKDGGGRRIQRRTGGRAGECTGDG
jgi:hypothetical protein